MTGKEGNITIAEIDISLNTFADKLTQVGSLLIDHTTSYSLETMFVWLKRDDTARLRSSHARDSDHCR
jgi:hypothetical protein